MALDNKEFFQSAPGVGSGLRAIADSIQPKDFAAVSGGATLAKLTAVTYNTVTAHWEVFNNGGANGTGTIQGFVWPDEIELNDSGSNNTEVLGNVMLSGRIHRDDIPLVAGNYSQSELDAALIGLRAKGFIVEGLADFN